MEQLIDLLYLDVIVASGVIYPTVVVQRAVQEFEERIKKNDGVLWESMPRLPN